MEKLNKRSSVPLYAQLKELLSERISKGEYKPGEKIPTELQLCAELDLSRPTVRQAVAELVAEGQLNIVKGKGTFVTDSSNVEIIDKYNSFSYSIFNDTKKIERKILDYRHIRKIPELICQAFTNDKAALSKGVYEIIWLEENNEHPLAYCKSYIPAQVYPDLLKDIADHKSMVEILSNKYPIVPVKAQALLSIRPAQNEEARYLDINKAFAVFVHSAKIYNRTGKICELVEAVLPTDRCAMLLDLVTKL